MKGLDIFRGNDSGKDREHLKEYLKKPWVRHPESSANGAFSLNR